MDKKDLRFFGIFIAIIVLILSMYFVMADLLAPTDLIFEQNTTANYDKEGIFTFNWTASAGDVANYSVYIYADGNIFLKGVNNSEIGYSFNNQTDANYTFHVAGVNETDSVEGANSTNIFMIVDDTDPTISYASNADSAGGGANRTWIFVNVSASDTNNDSLVFSLYDSTGIVFTNVTDYTTTSINWTGLTKEKVYYFNVTANDSATNSKLVTGGTRTFYLDGIAPIPSASCSPSSVIVGNTVTCTCGGTDATSGVASSTATSTPSTSETGTHTYTCTVTDNAGNSASTSDSYTVESSGGSATPPPFWTYTHSISDEVFEKGHTQEIEAKKRIRVRVETAYHYIGVVSLTETKATINITSDPIQVILGIGEDAKVDVTDDGFYDIYVILNAIANNKANVTIQKIYEEIPSEEEEEEDEEEEGERNLTWLWILIAVVVLAAIIGGGMTVKKKRK